MCLLDQFGHRRREPWHHPEKARRERHVGAQLREALSKLNEAASKTRVRRDNPAPLPSVREGSLKVPPMGPHQVCNHHRA